METNNKQLKINIMSTGNFTKEEASKYFAVLMNYQDEETGETVCAESWDYKAIAEEIRDALQAKKVRVYVSANQTDEHENRSYPSSVIGEVERGQVEIQLTLRSGYFEGANLDYHQTSEEKDTKGYQRDLERLKSIIEAVYTEYSIPLICTGRFSNGEAVYERVTPRTTLKSIVNDLQ